MRRTGLALAVLGLALLPFACRRAAEPPGVGRPPVILVSIDTLRSDRLPAYGYEGIDTPHLDRFAREAVLFERAYSHYPLTLPSHVSLFTGLLPPAHGVRDNRGYRLDDRHPTLASRLAEAGYRTAGFVSSSVLRGRTGVGRGFQLYDDTLPGRKQESLRVFPQRPGSETLTAAGDWLDGLAPGERFFLFLHLFEPHTPYDPPEPYRSRYADPYDAEIAYSDALVGELFDQLRGAGRYDDALIIVLSDHGEGLGDHGESEHGLLLYRETLQVPLMIRLPGGQRGGERIERPVALVDVMPTVLGLLKLPLGAPAGRPLFGADPPAEDRPIYSETWFTRHQYGWSELKSVIEGHTHYIQAPRPELYDLRADRGERSNLIGRQPFPDSLAAWVERTAAGTETTTEMSAAEIEDLAALGYIGGTDVEGDWRDLPDPKDHIHEVEELWSLIARIGTEEGAGVERRVLELTHRLGIRNEALFRSIAKNLLRAGRPGMALDVLSAYRDTGDPSTALVLAQALLELDRPEAAALRFSAVLEEDPDNVEAHLGLGLIALREGRSDEARAELERGVELDPALPEAWNGLGVIHAQRGDLNEAERLWRRAVELDPGMSDTWFNLALIHRRMGRPGEALSDLRRHAELVDGPERGRALALIRELEGEAGNR
jgi:arylsulfatase A-like enzyme